MRAIEVTIPETRFKIEVDDELSSDEIDEEVDDECLRRWPLYTWREIDDE